MQNLYKVKCSCGSKKRYIDCCFVQPNSWDKIMNRQKIATSLRWKIIDFAASKMPSQTEEALKVFFGDTYTKTTDISDEKMGPFLDWYIHDYRLLPENLSLIEIFFENRAALDDVERFLTSGWLLSSINCYQVVEVKPGYWLLLENIITGEKHLVINPELAEMTPPWSIFVGRLVPLGEVFEIDFIHHTLPPTALNNLKELLLASFAKRRSEYQHLDYPNYIRTQVSPTLPRLVLDNIDAFDLSPLMALNKELLAYKDVLWWLCTSFFSKTLVKKPANLGRLLHQLADTNLFDEALNSWPSGLDATNLELTTYLTWLEFIDACLVIHYGKEPAYDFNIKSHLLCLKKPSQPVFQPLKVTRTKINAESQALEKVSSVLHTHMVKRYPDKQIEAAIQIWQHFLGETTVVPEIRVPETWAGGVEYCLAKLLALPITQKELADEYAVSSGSISRIYNLISKKINLTSLDKSCFLS